MNATQRQSAALRLIVALAAALCFAACAPPAAQIEGKAPPASTAASLADSSSRDTVPEAAHEPAALAVPTPEAVAPTPEAPAVEPSPTATPARSAMPTSASVDAPPVSTVAPASIAPASIAPASITPDGRPSRVVSRGRTDRRAVALTFDAGSDRGHAERVLDVLAREQVTAAFGITGEWGNANRDLLARMSREGHVLINHSYDHPSFTGVSWSKVARTRADRDSQLRRTAQVFSATGAAAPTPYFRPPFGDYDAGVLADVGALGYPLTVMWSVDSMGWRGWTAPQITQRCLEGAHAGAIYIFHVGSASRDSEALPSIIEGLRTRGYEIVPLPMLLG